MHSVASNIKRLRTKCHMTQDALAERMHVTRQTVSNWENAKNQPDIDTLDALASAFGTDIHEVIYGNKKGAYPAYQEKYRKAVCVTLTVCILLFVLYLTVIPYLTLLRERTYRYGLEIQLLSYGFMAGIAFCLGLGALSALSLWFDCTVKKSKRYVLFAILMLTPILLVLFEYLSRLLFSQTPMYLMRAMAMNRPWVYALVAQVLPAASGVCVFFYRNGK